MVIVLSVGLAMIRWTQKASEHEKYYVFSEHDKEGIKYDTSEVLKLAKDVLMKAKVVREARDEHEVKYKIVYRGQEIGILEKFIELSKVKIGGVFGSPSNPKLELIYEGKRVGHLFIKRILEVSKS